MSIFRFAGDFCHGFAIFFLICFMIRNKTSIGISGKSQLLFFLVFTTRYLDLFIYYVSAYNTIMKLHYITLTSVTICCIFVCYKNTYQWKKDTMFTEILIVPSMILAICVNHQKTPMEILWTFSIYLEALAIVPQIYMILRTKKLHKHIMVYLVALGLYRTLYIPNWIYRYYSEGVYDQIVYSADIVYILIYLFGAAIMFCSGVKIVDITDNMLQRNIFFIINNSIPPNQLGSDCDRLVEEKNCVKAEVKMEIEK